MTNLSNNEIAGEKCKSSKEVESPTQWTMTYVYHQRLVQLSYSGITLRRALRPRDVLPSTETCRRDLPAAQRIIYSFSPYYSLGTLLRPPHLKPRERGRAFVFAACFRQDRLYSYPARFPLVNSPFIAFSFLLSSSLFLLWLPCRFSLFSNFCLFSLSIFDFPFPRASFQEYFHLCLPWVRPSCIAPLWLGISLCATINHQQSIIISNFCAVSILP